MNTTAMKLGAINTGHLFRFVGNARVYVARGAGVLYSSTIGGLYMRDDEARDVEPVSDPKWTGSYVANYRAERGPGRLCPCGCMTTVEVRS